MKRDIVLIDQVKCNGCGECINNCAEGAIEIVDGKARMISEIYCDGLGACLGHCPQDAISIVHREAVDYDEDATNEHLKSLGREPLTEVNQNAHDDVHASGCPSARIIQRERPAVNDKNTDVDNVQSMLMQWPIQLTLVSPEAPFLDNTELLIAADCVPFAYPRFHEKFLKDKTLVIACPKLDDVDFYIERLTGIFTKNSIKKITIVHMEVPCCFGLNHTVGEALKASKSDIPLEEVTIGIDGTIKGE